ncbi:MAG: insulinase family protein, partial [Nitrospinota bacterium]|nr:insulinase family protein [Nitrospinota bacterium]
MKPKPTSALLPFLAAILTAILLCAGSVEARTRATRTVLPNGMILIHIEQRSLPLVTVRITFRAGAAAEPAEKAGLANLTTQLLSEGTKNRTGTEVLEAIDELGGRIGFSAGRDTSNGGITVLRSDLEEGLRLFAEMALHPFFPEKELRRTVKENIGRIERS